MAIGPAEKKNLTALAKIIRAVSAKMKEFKADAVRDADTLDTVAATLEEISKKI